MKVGTQHSTLHRGLPCEHCGLKGSLLGTGGHSQPWISAGGCEHHTHTPSVLSSLRKNSQSLHAQESQKGWGCSVSPGSFDQLPGDTPGWLPRSRELMSCPVLSPFLCLTARRARAAAALGCGTLAPSDQQETGDGFLGKLGFP